MQFGVVTEVELVVATIRRIDAHLQQNIRRTLASGYAGAANSFRKCRDRKTDPILHTNLSQIQINPGAKGDRECIRAIVGAGRIHIQHVFDTVDTLLDWCCHSLRHSLSTRAGIIAGHFYRRRRNWWVLSQR